MEIISKIKNFFKKQKTNYQKVLEFNKLFSVQKYTKTPLSKVFDDEPELIKLRFNLILEEFTELKTAIQDKDIIETIDGAVDLLYVTYGLLSALNIDADKAFEIVSSSNLSKVCDTEKDAIESVNLYKNETPQRYDSPNYKKVPNENKWVVYNESTNKVLKNFRYVQADFSKLLN